MKRKPTLTRALACLLLFALFPFTLLAQDKTGARYGDVSPKDFEQKVYSIDSNASAVEGLRQFFDLIVKKDAEQIVFKKKK